MFEDLRQRLSTFTSAPASASAPAFEDQSDRQEEAGDGFDVDGTFLTDKPGDLDRRFSNNLLAEDTLKMLNGHHLEVIRLVAMGVKPSVIAKLMKISPITVRNIVRSDLAKARLQQILGLRDKHATEITNEIRLAAGDAVDTAWRIMTKGNSEDARLRAAFGLLDRGGFGPVKMVAKLETGVVRHVLDDIKQRARAMGVIKDTQTEDVSYEEVE